MIVVIDAGCAECHPGPEEPLIEAQTFPTVEDAKAAYADQGWLRGHDWTPHPQGGEHIVASQGSVWITPLSVLDGLL